MVVLLYPDISNLDELGNFKQKNFYTSKCNFFLHFKATDPMTSQPEQSKANAAVEEDPKAQFTCP